MKRRLALVVSLLLLASLACVSTVVTENAVESGAVLFEDSFSGPNGTWGQAEGDFGFARVSNEAYRIRLEMPNVNAWAHAGLQLTHVRVEVDLSPVGGPAQNRMGLVCRFVDDRNFYYFVVSADGYYGIGKVKDGQDFLLGMEQMRFSEAVQQGQSVNHLRADCIADLLVFYVNDELIAAAQDVDFARGDVGVIAGSFGQPGVEAVFDNFVVIKP